MTGAAGLYRDRAAWTFPVPDIPEGKHEQAMCSRFFLSEGSMTSNRQPVFFSFRKGHDRESVEGAAGLYRVRAVWIFPVPEIPEGKHEQAMCNRYFSFRREYVRDSFAGLVFSRRVAEGWIVIKKLRRYRDGG